MPPLNLPPKAARVLAHSGQLVGLIALGSFIGSYFNGDGEQLGTGLGALAGVMVSLASVVRAALTSNK